MRSFPDRRNVDPRWKANACDAACAKIWACARAACRPPDCYFDDNDFAECAARIPEAARCGLRGDVRATQCYFVRDDGGAA
jgi:hypothetical protein